MKVTCVVAALLLAPFLATHAPAHGRTNNSNRTHVDARHPPGTQPQGYWLEGREIAAPPWSFACINDQGPRQCDEPIWVYGSPDYLAQFENAFSN